MKLFKFGSGGLSDVRGVAVNDDEITVAARADVTHNALRARGRRIIVRGVCSAAFVFIGDVVLRRFAEAGSAMAPVLAVIVLCAFLLFLVSIVSWFRFAHTRRILRNNPWVEWLGRSGAIRVGRFELARVIVLAHPEWPNEEVRVLSPRASARSLPEYTPIHVWGAGSPSRTMAVSTEGGTDPMRAARPRLNFVRELLKRATRNQTLR